MVDNILVSCIAATTETKCADAISFTEANLLTLCSAINHSNGIPIIIGFDNNRLIGKVIYGEVRNKQLKIIAKVPNNTPSSYIVPGFKVLDANLAGKSIPQYNTIELINMGLIYSPQDEGVTNFQLIKW